MNKRAFTVLEIIVICIIIGILAAFGIPYFMNVMEESQASACATSLQALQKAVDVFIQENNVVPASLALLRQEDIDKAFAELMREKGAWRTRLAFFMQDIRGYGLAYAASMAYFPKVRCPKANSDVLVTYGLILPAGTTGAEYAALDDNTSIIVDIGASGQQVLRHRVIRNFHSTALMMTVTKNGYVGCFAYTDHGTVPDPRYFKFLPKTIPCENCYDGPSAEPPQD